MKTVRELAAALSARQLVAEPVLKEVAAGPEGTEAGAATWDSAAEIGALPVASVSAIAEELGMFCMWVRIAGLRCLPVAAGKNGIGAGVGSRYRYSLFIHSGHRK